MVYDVARTDDERQEILRGGKILAEKRSTPPKLIAEARLFENLGRSDLILIGICRNRNNNNGGVVVIDPPVDAI